MKTLPTEFRRQLERTVIEARDVAEDAARGALEALAVKHHEPYDHMDSAQRTLRRRLRAHARQLGDRRDARSGGHGIDHLVHECACEHWHGMLFARFLAENSLLIEPEVGVAITLDECEKLAKEEGVDKWTLAERFAHRMLPQVFRPDHPVFAVQFAREHRLKLEGQVEDIPAEVFVATDSLGWVYQFWQTKKKAEVNAAGNKIGADELPSVTQLFTDDYMVDFLLDNTLGAWHAGKVLEANPRLAENAESEDELRQSVALQGCHWNYLRFIQGQDDQWTPAAGTFVGWPNTAKELKCLDPCMGSGHFVVAMFERLVALRLAEEDLDEAAAVAAVIRDNLFGLEIDQRCTQIGAFNLALAAWRRVGHRPLPAMNLACSGLAPNTREADWLAIAGDNEKLRRGMKRLYQLFQKASVLGSLINPRASEGDLLEAAFHELQPLLEKALAHETNKDDIAREMAVAARGLAKAAEILAGQFALVATNVPYLGRPNQHQVLKNYCDRAHRAARTDLATCFVERSLDFCSLGASIALVTPQSWLFQPGYRRLRANLLEEQRWEFLARLGPRAFDTIGGEQVNVCLLSLSHCNGDEAHSFAGIDVTERPSGREKDAGLLNGLLSTVLQTNQLKNPDTRIALEALEPDEVLAKHAVCIQGLATSDDPQFTCCFWEFSHLNNGWEGLMGTVTKTCLGGGRERLIHWEDGAGRYYRHAQALKAEGRLGGWKSGTAARGKKGVLVRQMSTMPVTIYSGEFYDHNASVIVAHDDSKLAAIWAFASSPEFVEEVRKLDRSLKPSNNVFVKVPFDTGRWEKVAAELYPNGLPKPSSSDPTQWIFRGDAKGSDQLLQVAVARLLGYRWPRETGSSFQDCLTLPPDSLAHLADHDGIVCLPSLNREQPACHRLRELLGKSVGQFDERTLIASSGSAKGRTSDTLEDWLRDEFFDQHCKLFHDRPFIWHIWDGRKRDGFHALVNCHKLAEGDGKGRRLLESLIYTYLGDWINRQEDGVKRGEGGAEDRLAGALELHKRLVAILEGEPPFDLFVRWKPIEGQAIGWEPDIKTASASISVPSWLRTSPAERKALASCGSSQTSIGRKTAAKSRRATKGRSPGFGITASTPASGSMMCIS